MMNKDTLLATPMGQALQELSTEMNKINLPPVSLNVVGGFALMLHEKRPADSITDIDFVGTDLPDRFEKISDRIGRKHHMGSKWINNDVVLSGLSPEDFEFSTGKLHFIPAMDISSIRINVLKESDLLRMKIIAIDTALTAVESNGDFTRFKDMQDIKTLMQSQNMTWKEFHKEFDQYMINRHTADIIRCYDENGAQATKDAIRLIAENTLQKQRIAKLQAKEYTRSPFIDNLLNNLTKSPDDMTF